MGLANRRQNGTVELGLASGTAQDSHSNRGGTMGRLRSDRWVLGDGEMGLVFGRRSRRGFPLSFALEAFERPEERGRGRVLEVEGGAAMQAHNW